MQISGGRGHGGRPDGARASWRAFRVLKNQWGRGSRRSSYAYRPACKVVGQFVGTVTRRAIKQLVEHDQSNIDVYPGPLNPSSIAVLL